MSSPSSPARAAVIVAVTFGLMAGGYALLHRSTPGALPEEPTLPESTPPPPPAEPARLAGSDASLPGAAATAPAESPAPRPSADGEPGASPPADAAADATTFARPAGCDRRYRHCTAGPSTACETDTQFDVANCGLCHFDCRGVPHVVPDAVHCQMGRCDIAGACASGFGDCENGVLDGCEADLATTVAHCGACGHACAAPANARAQCAAARCAFACNAGFADCDNDAANGCENTGACP